VLFSLRYLHVALSEPGPGFSQFLPVGSLDGIPFQRRDSERGRAEPQTPGMAAGAEPGYRDRQSRDIGIGRAGIPVRLLRSDPCPGFHALQEVSGCDLLSDGSVRGCDRLGSKWQEFLFLELGSERFVVADDAPQVTKRGWERDEIEAEEFTNYLGHTCQE
ncbi:HA1F protein, partial [Tichodroma muraria]|nr:HA1F protein [Tichodroma muraria]